MTPAQMFLDHLPHIEKVVSHLCRRYHFRKEECEDFLGEVNEKLIEDDYAIIRKFKGESRLTTYLTMVISNCMKDYQNHIWGKWRPSKEAERLGSVAILLERLLVRDEHSFDEAVQILQTNYKVEMPWQKLYAISERLPNRTSRHMEGEEIFRTLPSQEERSDDRLAREEREVERCKALEALREVRKTLPTQDQLILNMQERGFSVADISRTLRLDQKQLYRRIQKIYKYLRDEVRSKGIREDSIEEFFDE